MDNNEEFMNATEGTSEEGVTSTANNNDFYTDNEVSNYDNTVYGDYDYTPEKKNPVGLLSMIFGFVALLIQLLNCGGNLLVTVSSIIPGLAFALSIIKMGLNGLGFLLAVAAIVLGIIGIAKKNSSTGMGITGLITGAILLIYKIISWIFAIIAMIAGGAIVGGLLGTGLLEEMINSMY